MKAWLKQLSDNLNFTPTERIVALTLVGAFLLGLGIRLIRGDDSEVPRFDYSAADAEFSSRSVATPQGGPAGSGRAPVGMEGTGPATPPPRPAAGGAGAANAARTRVDLNRATKSQLMSLPGVGDVIAERILRYREDHGAFAGVDDLLKVRGIGRKKLEHIAPFCFVEN
jgi:competence protein ComEA